VLLPNRNALRRNRKSCETFYYCDIPKGTIFRDTLGDDGNNGDDDGDNRSDGSNSSSGEDGSGDNNDSSDGADAGGSDGNDLGGSDDSGDGGNSEDEMELEMEKCILRVLDAKIKYGWSQEETLSQSHYSSIIVAGYC
jgi:hypothetical protein